MNFKKRINGSWVDTPNYIHNTSTDTITTLPAVVYANGTTATVGLKGQTVQSSIPSPTSPVMPQGTGERTGNLWGEDYPSIKVDTPTYRSIYVGDGTFTLSTTAAQYRASANLFFLAGNVGSGASTQNNGVWNGNPRTVTTVDGYVTIAYRYYTNDEASDPRSNDVMLNLGSTPLPYEPYGYKIPISSANTTTPVYLGEVETTRKIKKLVLTGDETWTYESAYTRLYTVFPNSLILGVRATPAFCTHFQVISDGRPLAGVPYNSMYSNSVNMVWFFKTEYTDVESWKAYLAAQYAAGTPVCVWYVLAEPETAVVNEPLRKIGDYADTVSGITIPTIAGTNALSIGTTLQPSEVTVNYKGWHPVQSVHERDNSAWT